MKTNRAHTYGVWKGRQESVQTIGYWPERTKPLPAGSQKRKGIFKRWALTRHRRKEG